jgi:hypothetical protein
MPDRHLTAVPDLPPDRDPVRAALAPLDTDKVPAGATPVPSRITTALDANALDGPDVDTACGTWEGNPDGDVDMWERGEATPTRAQIRLLAALTEMPIAYFYEPADPPGTMWICSRSGPRAERCQQVSTIPTPPAGTGPPQPQQGALW